MGKTIIRQEFSDGTSNQRETETVPGDKQSESTVDISEHSSDQINRRNSSKGGM